MNKFYFFIIILLIPNCSIKKVINHHGIHNLEKKQTKLIINETNRNDIINLIGPPSTKSTFDNDLLIYIERKTSSSRLRNFGKKKLLTNNVLLLEIDSRGLLVKKSFFNKDDMNNIQFDKNETSIAYEKNSFIYEFLFSLRQKIDDPLGKKRIKN
tara:strand:- start:461 stop:925 length:465 start_codon:yes stop_codon:yes gene_type:complete